MDSEFGRLTPAGMWASCAAMSLCTRIAHDSSNKLSNMGGRINSGARSTKAKAPTGVRVSRVVAGLAERLGLRQEDRLAYIGDEDIRGADYDNVRQMLLNLSYPTELVFERKARRGGGFVSRGASPLKQAPADAEPAGRPATRKRAREGQSRSPSPADAPPPPARPMRGDLVEQLDFLAAQQLAEEKKAAAAGATTTGRKKAAPALGEASVGNRSGSPSNNRAAAASAAARSSSSLATPGLTSLALAMAGRSKSGGRVGGGQRLDRSREHRPRDPLQERRRQQPQQGEEEEEPEGEKEVEVVSDASLRSPLLPPSPRSRSYSDVPPRARKLVRMEMEPRQGQGGEGRGEGAGRGREGEENGEGRKRGGEGGLRMEAYRGREGEGEGAGDVPGEGDKLMASPAMRPPLWVEVLVGLTMADMAGTDSARAAVVGKEVRDVIAKEFVILQRLGKELPAHVTLAQYTTLRSASLMSSSGYRKLRWFEEMYLVDHEDELADIAEESFIGDLVGDSHRTTQDVVRRALASHERAMATTGVHRLLRNQGLLDVEEARAAGKKTERQATEVIAKIRDWEKAARVGEHFAVEVSGAVTGRAELMRDAVELLMAGIERQRGRLETLATFRMLGEPATEGERGPSA
eukprot:jgi/Undpi1/1544/HiC_scaffold_11.g04934.m1